ncbi:TPA: hypothetical protein LTW96_004553 [Enterobacter hormaechei]|nr:hypothetical protein [Enterobacter hormaechei]HBL8943148.1 hypothetical protein [Enterobacter hormaechei]HBL9103544.1 hypothetical protein [Enterobacter hormaechei]
MKDQMMDIESERFDKWLAENYPDVVPGSEEWEQAANLYGNPPIFNRADK